MAPKRIEPRPTTSGARVAEGDVPTELAGAVGVAEFVEGEYALHRFRHTT